MTTQTASPISLDACLVNTIIAATSDILESATQTPVTFKAAKGQRAFMPYGNMLAEVGFASDEGGGMAVISFPQSLGNIVVGRLLQMTPERLSEDDQCDGIGELVSMVSGEAKSRLSAVTGSKYNLALPHVMMGRYPEVPGNLQRVPVLMIVFEAEGQTFTVQIAHGA